MSDRTNWLLVSSPDNFETSRARGFDIAGMKSRHRKKAERVKAGDRVVYYTVGLKAVAGISEATGPYFESSEHIWTSNKEGEEYPFRFPVKPLYIRDKGDYVPMVDLVPVLEYPKRWPAEHWTLAWQGNVHVLSDADYQIIEDAVRAGK
ncbi:MAG TPA: EVE domain-containing protein [Capsulimonadaceae bacterium]|jgi:hypothetical protein